MPSQPGYFRGVLTRGVVSGPIIATKSTHDTAVGVLYPAAVGLVREVDFAVKLPKYGGIGSFGIQGTSIAGERDMLDKDGDYSFASGKIYNLESSKYIAKGEGASGAHSDIAGPEVAHAIWQAAFVSLRRPLMSEDVQAVRDDEMPLPFGVRAATGEPLSGLQTEALKAIGVDPKAITDRALPQKHLAADESVKDPNDLKQAGWGIVLPGDVPSEVMSALKPLLELRQQQAVVELGGYAPGRSPRDWLNGKGVTWGVVDPKKGVPLYLLLIGGPKQIPFEFQYMLDSYWNVGRLDLAQPGRLPRLRRRGCGVRDRRERAHDEVRSALWVTKNAADRATGLLHNQVGVPLARGDNDHPALGQEKRFKLSEYLGEHATRANLESILRGAIPTGRPALLFTGSHGVAFDPADPAAQREGQGALLSQAWENGVPATPEHYLRAADLPADTSVHGMIHFLFACYGGGCPRPGTPTSAGRTASRCR